ncbi:MAG: GNAT family N-acetyltransferase [Rhodoferax sp.]
MSLTQPQPWRVSQVDYQDAQQMNALLTLLDGYARDPMGGGEPLRAEVLARLPQALASRPYLFSVMAFDDTQGGLPIGLMNCVEGFSTFAAQALVNIHDVVVAPSHRGRGVGRALFEAVEALARARGACKLTLEVLSGNLPAQTLYRRMGFANYQLDPALGEAWMMQKWLEPDAHG